MLAGIYAALNKQSSAQYSVCLFRYFENSATTYSAANMLVCAFNRLVSVILLMLILLTGPCLMAPAKTFCGKGLANILKMLCGGAYNDKSGIVDRGGSDQDDFVGVTQECCKTSCTVTQLTSYCAVKPSLEMLFKAVSSMHDDSPSKGSKSNASAGQASRTAPAKSGGRFQEIGKDGFDLSSLLDRMDYESLPTREKR